MFGLSFSHKKKYIKENFRRKLLKRKVFVKFKLYYLSELSSLYSYFSKDLSYVSKFRIFRKGFISLAKRVTNMFVK